MNILNGARLESLILDLLPWLVSKCQAFTGDTNICQIKVHLPKHPVFLKIKKKRFSTNIEIKTPLTNTLEFSSLLPLTNHPQQDPLHPVPLRTTHTSRDLKYCPSTHICPDHFPSNLKTSVSFPGCWHAHTTQWGFMQ